MVMVMVMVMVMAVAVAVVVAVAVEMLWILPLSLATGQARQGAVVGAVVGAKLALVPISGRQQPRSVRYRMSTATSG